MIKKSILNFLNMMTIASSCLGLFFVWVAYDTHQPDAQIIAACCVGLALSVIPAVITKSVWALFCR